MKIKINPKSIEIVLPKAKNYKFFCWLNSSKLTNFCDIDLKKFDSSDFITTFYWNRKKDVFFKEKIIERFEYKEYMKFDLRAKFVRFYKFIMSKISN